MNNEIYSAKEMVTETVASLFKNVSADKFSQARQISESWEKILLSIKSSVSPDCGKKMLDHSRIIDIQNGAMLIELDHPGWMQLFETYHSYILKGIAFRMPELKVTSLTYRLKRKKDADTSRVLSREEAEKAMERQIPAPDKTEREKTLAGNVALPPELEAIFSRLREAILTNDRQI